MEKEELYYLTSCQNCGSVFNLRLAQISENPDGIRITKCPACKSEHELKKI